MRGTSVFKNVYKTTPAGPRQCSGLFSPSLPSIRRPGGHESLPSNPARTSHFALSFPPFLPPSPPPVLRAHEPLHLLCPTTSTTTTTTTTTATTTTTTTTSTLTTTTITATLTTTTTLLILHLQQLLLLILLLQGHESHHAHVLAIPNLCFVVSPFSSPCFLRILTMSFYS